MLEKRKVERRYVDAKSVFPLLLATGCVVFERRFRPSRRLNDIVVSEVDCMDYISEILRHGE